MRKLLPFLVLAALAYVSASSVSESFTRAPAVHALTSQSVATYTGSPAASTAVITGPASTKLHVYALDIGTVTTGGIFTFTDGVSGPAVLNCYLVGGTPRGIRLSKVFPASGLALAHNVLALTPPATITLALNARVSSQ